MLAPPPKFPSSEFNPAQFEQSDQAFWPLIRNIRKFHTPPADLVFGVDDLTDNVFLFGGPSSYQGSIGSISPFTVKLPPPTTVGMVFQYFMHTTSTGTLLTLTTTTGGNYFVDSITGTTLVSTISPTSATAGARTYISTGSLWVFSYI